MYRVFIWFSVHERFFDGVAARLQKNYGVNHWAGFCWGEDQERLLSQEVHYDPLIVFTRDILPHATGPVDVEYLRAMARGAPVPLTQMIFAERHLLRGRSYNDVLKLAEVIFRTFDLELSAFSPDWILAEDVSCLASYILYTVAAAKGIPIYYLGYGRIPYHLAIYHNPKHSWEDLNDAFEEIRQKGLTATQRIEASELLEKTLSSKKRPGDLEPKAGFRVIDSYDVGRAVEGVRRYLVDRNNPTLVPPQRMIASRAKRLVNDRFARATNVFDKPDPDQPYIAFPLHYEPEASTLVRAPYYLNQLALVEDIAKSLPTGYQLYVKEHQVARGRRPAGYYRRLKSIFGVRVIAPWEDSWRLVENSSAVAVITSTMGWEALLCGKPVIAFGHAFFNSFPEVYRAFEHAKETWHELFERAVSRPATDRELLLCYLAAIQQAVYPGYIRNPNTLPAVLDPENLDRVSESVATRVGLEAA
jgi:hypothetical protein